LPKNERKKYFLASSLSGFVALFWIPSIKIFLIVADIKSFWIQPPTLEVYTGLLESFGNAESVVL
jgi:hypothetical protein